MMIVPLEAPAPSIAKSVESALRDRGIAIDVEVVEDPAQVISRVRNGEFDLGLVKEPDQPIAGLSTVTPIYPSVLHVLYDRDDAPKGFADLIRGSSIYTGPAGAAASTLLLDLASDFDVAEDEFGIVTNPQSTRPDVYFMFSGLLAGDAVRRLDGYRLFSFAKSDDRPGSTVADSIVIRHGHLRTFLLPRSLYPSLNDQPALTLATRSIIISREDLDSDTIYDVVETLMKSAQEIALSYPLVTSELSETIDASKLMLPPHRGTTRYLERDAPGFIERYVEVLALSFTVLLTMGSGVVALYRHRRQARKDRVDVYYAKLLDMRAEFEDATDDTDFGAARRQVLELQREVLDLLIDERIGADSSLIAFVSLSNQIINELGAHT